MENHDFAQREWKHHVRHAAQHVLAVSTVASFVIGAKNTHSATRGMSYAVKKVHRGRGRRSDDRPHPPSLRQMAFIGAQPLCTIG